MFRSVARSSCRKRFPITMRPMRASFRWHTSVLLVVGLLSAGPVASADQARYEAEQATIINGAVASNHPGFTGTGFVDTTNAVGAAVEFTVSVAEANPAETLVFRYANGSTTDRPATLTV